MKIKLENIEKKIIISDRNQPRIYLTKQEAQRFDLLRMVYITIEQEDYPIIDTEVCEYFNYMIKSWVQEHNSKDPIALEKFIQEILLSHQFEQVARDMENVAYIRKGKYINWNQKAGFNIQIDWLKNNVISNNFILDSSDILYIPDFAQIMNDILKEGLIISGIAAKEDGTILYISPNWKIEPEDVKQCIYDWQHQQHRVKLQDIRYSMIYSQPEYFSAINHQKKKWLVGAGTPQYSGERYFILGVTDSGTDGKNAYVDVARAVLQIKTSPEKRGNQELSDSSRTLVKNDYEIMISLEKQLGVMIPVLKKVENMTFGCVIVNKHIVALGLNGKKITSLPENIGELSQLQELYISANHLKTLPDSIGKLKMLTILNANSNQLTTLPESIGNLPNLKNLHLFSNQITILPSTIGNLHGLKSLWLQENKLTSIPSNIGQLSALTSLNVAENKLQTLPNEIGLLKELRQLILNHNPIQTLPESIGELENLEYLGLDLDHPEFKSLPESLTKLTKLQRLEGSMNNLQLYSEQLKNLLKILGKQGCLELPFMLNENKDPGKKKIQEIKEKIIAEWNALSPSMWDEQKKVELIELIKAGEPILMGIPQIQDIRYKLVQNGYEYQRIQKWQAIDEIKEPEYLMKSLVELYNHLKSRKDLVHDGIWGYFKESIQTKSKKFQNEIPFVWNK